TVSQLAGALARDELPARAVAITFDDGAASVASTAVPLLAERGLTATVFCVAGHLGGTSDWPTQPSAAPRLRLASAGELRGLVAAGFEIGSHGFRHAPLDTDDPAVLDRELRESRRVLEDAVGAEVRAFAYPYGVHSRAARDLARETYAAACGTRLDLVRRGADRFDLPRVDAYYVGNVTFALSLVGWFGLVVDSGTELLNVRDIAREPHRFRELAERVLGLRLTISILSAGLFVVAVETLGRSTRVRDAVVLFAVVLP